MVFFPSFLRLWCCGMWWILVLFFWRPRFYWCCSKELPFFGGVMGGLSI
jgi:hypothetical protein